MSSAKNQSPDKWNFLVIPNGNDRTTTLFISCSRGNGIQRPQTRTVESQCRHCPLTRGLGKVGIDENPNHHGFGFVRVQLASAGWMHLPMRRWADATALQQHLDIAPPCMGICGPVAPSIAPINPPRIPALGATSCRQAQFCDQFGNCRWQQVCR